MILLLTLSILILSVGVVSANQELSDSLNPDDSSDIELVPIISPVDENPLSDNLSDDGNDDETDDNDNETDDNDNESNNDTNTGVLTPEINDTINSTENLVPGKVSGQTYINITNAAFNLEDIGELPPYYDLRDYNWVTPVKNQGSSGSCWTFASTAALESFLLKTEGVEYDFSENNMKNIMGSYSENGTDFGPNDGGNEVMIMAYYLRWDGAVNETDDPYNASSIRSPYNLPLAKIVSDIVWIPKRANATDNDQIKWALMTYGALYTGIYWSSSYEKGETYYYTGTQAYGNHAITIVGWDDTYSASNFRFKPAGDGAFIIKNSWGTIDSYGNPVGKDGYYYVSYYDSVFAGRGLNEYFSAMAISNVENTSAYKSNYYYDVYGNTFDAIGYKNSTAWFANEFVSKSNNPLKAVGFYTYGSSNYEAFIYVNNSLTYKQSGILTGAGFHTVKLNKFVNLYTGDKFRVAIKLTTPNCNYPIAIETYHSGFTSGAKASANQSFVSSNGVAWEDLTKISGYSRANVCLKAYTTFAADLNIATSSNVSFYSEGEEIELTINLTNRGDLTSAELYSNLDENVKIVSYNATNGVFDTATKIWTIEDFEENSTNILRLVIQINTKQANITNSFLLNTSLYNMNKNSSSIDLLRRISAKLSANELNTAYKSGELFDVTIVNEEMEEIRDVEVRFDVFDEDGELIDTFYNTTNDKGKVYLATNFNVGSYSVKISLVDPYFEGELIGRIVVKKANTKVTADKSESILNKTTSLSAKITSNGEPVNDGYVKFYIDDEFAGSSKVNEGYASIEYKHSKVGSFNILAVYEENSNYLESKDENSLEIEKITAQLKSKNIATIYKDFDSYNITVLDDKNKGIKGIDILFNIYEDGNLLANNYLATNNEGKASLNMDLSAGHYTIEASILDDEYQAIKNNTITIDKAIAKLTAKQNGNSYNDSSLKISFKQAITNKAYANQKILVKFSNGKMYSVRTDENGEAILKLDIGAGEFNFQLNSANNNIIGKSAGVVKIEKLDANLEANPISINYGDNGSLESKLTDANNNPLADTEISFTIENEKINKVTDKDGIARLDLSEIESDLNPGTHTASVNVNNENYNVQAKNVNIDVLKINASIDIKSISKYYNDKTQFEAKLTDNNGNPLENKSICFKNDNGTITAITNEKGIASIDTEYLPGNYSFKVSINDDIYNADEKSASVEVLDIPSQIEAGDLVKYYRNGSKLSISLKDGKGNGLANKKITITIASKNYSRTTDSEGKVNFAINLNEGTYSVKISFEETCYKSSSKTVSVKVVKPKITYPSKTIKKGQKLTVVFKDSDGKVIKGQKVTIKIGSKEYSRTTDSQGRAFLKINLKIGKYSLVSSIANTTAYGTTTASTTITVK